MGLRMSCSNTIFNRKKFHCAYQGWGLCAGVVRKGCALGLCAGVCACLCAAAWDGCAWGLCARLCAQVVRPLCALRVKSIVRFERHNPFGLFRIAISAWHNPFDHCAKFISLKFFSVRYSIILEGFGGGAWEALLWYFEGFSVSKNKGHI